MRAFNNKKFIEEMKKTDWLWSNLIDPDYVERVSSKEEFEHQLQNGNIQVIKKENRNLLNTYMKHHNLKYSSPQLRMKRHFHLHLPFYFLIVVLGVSLIAFTALNTLVKIDIH